MSHARFCLESSKVSQDFTVVVDMTVISGLPEGCLLFRLHVENGYHSYCFSVNINGYYKIAYFGNNANGVYGINTIQDFTRSPAIFTGLNAKNTLAAIVRGGDLSFYINRTFLVKMPDSRYTSGSFAFACYPGNSAVGEVAWSNLLVYD
jgi:hypothetical protein